jgi:KTSC domain
VMEYKGVSGEVHRRFMAAPSPVAFFEDKIEEDFTGRRLR